ncbi:MULTISPECIES: DUF188 domain-containing protein [Eubacterium]|uniref:Uncharacterized protein n=1 Tax=Eubacterium barkeri TaxID=1528 RepID=A0A1H3G143_EUBBA|nr:DUF188 domain-containing protein [Eubacterium barkeri]SDX96956.1 hypothetical protein SAMN04488579_11250 [Eubacterium barkeri]
MRILIDGDACPKSAKVVCHELSKEYNIPAFIFTEGNRDWDEDTDEDVMAFSPSDYLPGAMDYKLSALAGKGDIIVTHDYSLASVIYPQVLAVVHPCGFIYNATNMDQLLYERFMTRKSHNPKKGKEARIKKRSSEEDQALRQVLLDLITPADQRAPFIHFK